MRSYARNEESLFFGVVSNVSTLQFMVGVTYKMGVYAQRSCISFGFKFCSDIKDGEGQDCVEMEDGEGGRVRIQVWGGQLS